MGDPQTKMSSYFSMTGHRSARKSAPARFPPETDEIELWELVESLNDLSEWPDVTLNCHGRLGHFPPTDILGRLCSPELRNVLEPFATSALWLPATIINGNASIEYFFLHFCEIPDVLDPDKTEYAGDRLFRPHFVYDAIIKHKMFILKKLGNLIYVHNDVKRAIETNEIDGLEFESARVSPCPTRPPG